MDDFPIYPSASDPNAFQWEAPEGTTYVNCALFGCTPVIQERGIVNADDCIIVHDLFKQQKGTFDLGNPQLEPARPAGCDAGCEGCVDAGTTPSQPNYRTEFAVGCWAYGDVGLIGATLLVPVDPKQDEIKRYGMIPTCDPVESVGIRGEIQIIEVDGKDCLLPGVDLIGTCWRRHCRQRCVESATCQSPLRLGVSIPECPDAGAEMETGSGGAPDAAPNENSSDAGFAGSRASEALRDYACRRPFAAHSYVGLCARSCEVKP